ncbi:hypothetical protein [Flavobacterium dankookense]|uniref:Uncharacterized protein n=1 Tax=Flavobacterium dankookense TaxID=706186 RepID=A0A4R6Q5M2_9FLAO|nr:hypothetical protein [Flavobacterium dankookense]TDP57377.1 hypothetical protein BC748_2897 [Flavobacterium dankookense]
MKIIICLLILTSNLSFAQNFEPIINDTDPDYNCKKTKNTPFEKLVTNFPLNETITIQLVSFTYDNTIYIDENGNEKHPIIDSIARIGEKLNLKNLKEIKTLELPKIIELADLLYNFNYNPKKNMTNLAFSCYDPRNAIVFLDKQNNVIEYIEICFSCLGYHIFNKSNFGEFCTGKIDLIKNFFFLNGIKYGVIKD